MTMHYIGNILSLIVDNFEPFGDNMQLIGDNLQ